MFLDRLLNSGNAPMLAQSLRFHQARQQLLQENVANASTPDYLQKDLSLPKFQSMLREVVAARDTAPPGSVSFDEAMPEVSKDSASLLFHDGNNRSMEQLMADGAKNAMMHNFVVELLRKQFGSIDAALKERVT
jgi:flagellar basal-body rod protein FlgB